MAAAESKDMMVMLEVFILEAFVRSHLTVAGGGDGRNSKYLIIRARGKVVISTCDIQYLQGAKGE
jgi:hypothetical protein